MLANLQSELREHLDRDESLIWAGKPKQGIVFRTSDSFIIPFSLFWLGFAIIWTLMAAQGSWVFALFGIPFVIMGLNFVFGRFIIEKKQREHTTYGITENRILIKSGIFTKNIKSLSIKTLSDIELSENGDGSGTISIGPKNPFNIWGNGLNWWPGMKVNSQLEMISNARKVYNQIIELQRKN